jgi:hypothetical protein
MKTIINLTQTPNQLVSANITDINGEIHVVDFRLRTMPDGSLITDITLDGDDVVYGQRCVNNMPLLLGYSGRGNFYFTDLYENTDPVYTRFGTQYELIYDNEYTMD